MPASLPNSAAMDALVEELLTKDVYIVDYLPRTVPQNSGGQYFDVEYLSLIHISFRKAAFAPS